jgi:hypothetical protein
MEIRLFTLLLAGSLATFACKRDPSPAPAPAAEAADAVEAAPDARDASMASVSGQSDPNCVGPIEAGTPEALTIGGKTFERNGSTLTLQGEAGDAGVRIGVLANMNQATAENLFNLRRYLEFFQKEGVELIVVAGDTGEERKDIEPMLAAVAESGLPVLAIAGNREKTADFVESVRVVRETHANLLDGNRVRHLAWHGLDVITLPATTTPGTSTRSQGWAASTSWRTSRPWPPSPRRLRTRCSSWPTASPRARPPPRWT